MAPSITRLWELQLDHRCIKIEKSTRLKGHLQVIRIVQHFEEIDFLKVENKAKLAKKVRRVDRRTNALKTDQQTDQHSQL